MVVRVRLRINVLENNRSKELIVLVNGGAESPKPCLVVDTSVAKELGVWPPREAEVFLVEEASSIGSIYLLPDIIVLELLDEEGKVLSSTRADLAIQIRLTEPLITDVTIDALGIQVLSFGKGLWKHVSDPPSIVRKSAKPLQ